MEQLLTTAANGGFAVAIAAYLLVRMERELKMLRHSIEQLRHCAVCRFKYMEEIEEEVKREEAQIRHDLRG